MIFLPPRTLPPATAKGLADYQLHVDGTPGGYEDQVAEADSHFKTKNTATDPVFKVVRAELEAMCSGAMRCVYCEDSARDQVEHFRPKSLYPGHAFEWENYAYICGRCNSRKEAKFAVFRSSDGKFEDVSRSKKRPSIIVPIVPPTPGRPVFLFGRVENPLDFLELDLVDTFQFIARKDLVKQDDIKRATYTYEEMRLNKRDELRKARKIAYGDYRARVVEYCTVRDAGASALDLDRLRKALQGRGHPTVWHEIKRQHATIPELKTLFAKVPEALTW